MYYIYKKGIFIAPKETSIYYLLNFIPYDEKLINQNFGFSVLIFKNKVKSEREREGTMGFLLYYGKVL